MIQHQVAHGGTSPASHEAYVRKVVTALADRGIRADDVQAVAETPRRAWMTVSEVEPLGTHWQAARWVRLRWDEDRGWSWQVLYSSEREPRSPIFFGVSAVPAPDAVADWMLVSLAHPEVTPNRQDGPLTTPDLDARLRGYDTPTT